MTNTRKPFGSWPETVAWREGRRIYVVTPYGSDLNAAVRAAGGTWDRDARALWVGSGKVDTVETILTTHVGSPEAVEQAQAATAARREQIAAIVAAGLAITLAPAEVEARAAVKAAGGVWDPATSRWYMPSPEAHAEATAAVAQHRASRAAARRRSPATSSTADAVRQATRRTILEPQTHRTLQWRLPKSRRPAAEAAAPAPGSVQVHEGRAWLVLARSVEAEVDIDDTFVGWLVVADCVEVEPGAPERQITREREHRAAVTSLMTTAAAGSDWQWAHAAPAPAGATVIRPDAQTWAWIDRTEAGLVACRQRMDHVDDIRTQWRPLSAEETDLAETILGWGAKAYQVTVGSQDALVQVLA